MCTKHRYIYTAIYIYAFTLIKETLLYAISAFNVLKWTYVEYVVRHLYIYVDTFIQYIFKDISIIKTEVYIYCKYI